MKAQPSNVRQGLALICVALIGLVLSYAAQEGPSLMEGIGYLAMTLSGFAGLLGLAYVAYGLLRD